MQELTRAVALLIEGTLADWEGTEDLELELAALGELLRRRSRASRDYHLTPRGAAQLAARTERLAEEGAAAANADNP